MKKLWNKLKVSYFKSSSDKRKYPRLAISIKVTNMESGSFTYYQATNISLGGMFLKSSEPLPLGTPLSLQFSLPSMSKINVSAKVVRIQQANTDDSFSSGMGVRFGKLPHNVSEAIDSFIKMKM